MGQPGGLGPAVRHFISTKAAGLCRRLVPRLRDDFKLAEYARSNILPIPPARPDAVRNAPLTMLGVSGINLDTEQQLRASPRGPRPGTKTCFASSAATRRSRSSTNGFFMTPDAEIYAAMILDRQPRRIIEVGSGFSTLTARKTIGHAGYSTRLVAIDPHPRTDVQAVTDELILRPVEESDLINFELSAEDLLFIDSSHLCRTRGDLPYLYCQVLPSLPAGILVHVHDIFLPYDYPNLYDRWCYTELYLLSCMLAHSSRYHPLLGAHHLTRLHRDRMQAVFGPLVGSEEETHYFGCSFWFEVRS